MRDEFYSLPTETKQNQLVFDYFRSHSSCLTSISFMVAGKSVCETCWRYVYGLRYTKFSNLKDQFHSGVIMAEHGRKGMTQPREPILRATTWLRMFVNKLADKMPMSSNLHLPSCLTKLDVYNLAHDDLTQGGMECCSMSSFYSMWSREFKNVSIPKVMIITEGKVFDINIIIIIKNPVGKPFFKMRCLRSYKRR